MHKFLGVRPRSAAKNKCNLCWQKISEERKWLWYQGRPYHRDCIRAEMNKPLHLRFNK